MAGISTGISLLTTSLEGSIWLAPTTFSYTTTSGTARNYAGCLMDVKGQVLLYSGNAVGAQNSSEFYGAWRQPYEWGGGATSPFEVKWDKVSGSTISHINNKAEGVWFNPTTTNGFFLVAIEAPAINTLVSAVVTISVRKSGFLEYTQNITLTAGKI